MEAKGDRDVGHVSNDAMHKDRQCTCSTPVIFAIKGLPVRGRCMRCGCWPIAFEAIDIRFIPPFHPPYHFVMSENRR